MMKKKIIAVIFGIMLLSITTGCNQNLKDDSTDKEELKGNCTVVECMKKINATNTIEEINAIIGFETTTDAMIGSDPIWKFDSKNWISFKTSNGSTTIQATIDKESIKNDDIQLPSSSDLQKDLNNGSFTYGELVEKVGGDGTNLHIRRFS